MKRPSVSVNFLSYQWNIVAKKTVSSVAYIILLVTKNVHKIVFSITGSRAISVSSRKTHNSDVRVWIKNAVHQCIVIGRIVKTNTDILKQVFLLLIIVQILSVFFISHTIAFWLRKIQTLCYADSHLWCTTL